MHKKINAKISSKVLQLHLFLYIFLNVTLGGLLHRDGNGSKYPPCEKSSGAPCRPLKLINTHE